MKINWIGCKKKLLPQIISHLPKQFKTYYELFLGSGVLYFYLKPQKVILNDITPNNQKKGGASNSYTTITKQP